jgi:hypothetical protein
MGSLLPKKRWRRTPRLQLVDRLEFWLGRGVCGGLDHLHEHRSHEDTWRFPPQRLWVSEPYPRPLSRQQHPSSSHVLEFTGWSQVTDDRCLRRTRSSRETIRRRASPARPGRRGQKVSTVSGWRTPGGNSDRVQRCQNWGRPSNLESTVGFRLMNKSYCRQDQFPTVWDHENDRVRAATTGT